MCRGHGLHGRIDQCVRSRRIGRRIGAQRGEVAATGAGALTGGEHELAHHMVGPAFAELPGLGHALGDLRQLDAGGTEETAYAVTYDVGKHRAECLVIRRNLVYQRIEVANARLGGAVHTGHAELGADVHEQLVATRGDAIGERVGRVVLADLLRTHLGGVGEQHLDGVMGTVVEVRHIGAGNTARRCHGCHGLGGFHDDARGGVRCGDGLRRGGRVGRRGPHIVDLGHERVGIGHIHASFVAAHVVHGHMAAGELRQTQRLRGKIRKRGRIAQTHFNNLLDAQASLFGRTEQQRLRFDPAHRRGELPGEQLGEQQTAELLVVGGIGIPHGVVGQCGGDALAGHHVENLLRELLRHLERRGHEIRNVEPFERATVVDLGGKQRVELVAELGHTLAQQRRMERHIDAGHENERRLAAIFGHAPSGIRLERLEACDRAGNGVLLAGEIVVDDLEELAARLGHRLHVFLHMRVVHAELVGPEGAHAVVRTALRVTVDQVVHGGAAVEHEFEHGLQRDHMGEGAQRVVFAE